MKIGKLSNRDLERLVLSKIPFAPTQGEAGPSVGLDSAVMDMGDGFRLVLSSDPITAADADAGRLAVHVSCNDIAASGIRPAGIMVVLVVPPDCEESRISAIVEQAAATAASLGVRIAGGHTEVSDTVVRPMVTTTAFGWTRGNVVLASGAQAGDTICMTKTAGIEGTAILARDRRDILLSRIGAERLSEAEALIEQVSVLREGVAAAALGVHAMHDATEGGILGAVWELCAASGQGCLVQAGKIPVHPATAAAARVYGIDPLRLIASGSMILATDRPDSLIAGLAKEGISCTAIGTVEPGDCRILCPDGTAEPLEPPAADELYKTTPTSYY